MQSELRIYAGPSCSGKGILMQTYGVIGDFVNTGEIARRQCLNSEDAALLSDRIKEIYLRNGESFTVKSLLDSEHKFDLIRQARSRGFIVSGVFVFTQDPAINIARQLERTRAGGHCEPVERILATYKIAMQMLPRFVEECDQCVVIDNTERPVVVHEKTCDAVSKLERSNKDEKD